MNDIVLEILETIDRAIYNKPVVFVTKINTDYVLNVLFKDMKKDMRSYEIASMVKENDYLSIVTKQGYKLSVFQHDRELTDEIEALFGSDKIIFKSDVDSIHTEYETDPTDDELCTVPDNSTNIHNGRTNDKQRMNHYDPGRVKRW